MSDARADDLLVVGARTVGGGPIAVRVERGVISEIGDRLRPRPGDEVLDARGGILLPGLHDHHVHLRSMAAATTSVDAGPRAVRDAEGLGRALRAARRGLPEGAWIRAIGYAEQVAGRLTASALDGWVSDRPVRVQHRAGGIWFVNTLGLRTLGAAESDHPGIERDDRGEPTGALVRMDGWIRERLHEPEPDLAVASRMALVRGVTGLTDATAGMTQPDVDALAAAVADSRIAQRLTVMAEPDIRVPDAVGRGPVKIMLDNPSLPLPGDLARRIRTAHDRGQPVAVHVAGAEQLAVTVAALREAGPVGGDRIEHGSLIPAPMVDDLASLGVVVVTQPNFIAERGDEYLASVPPEELDTLYRVGTLRRAGIGVAAGTDAPFGDPDPWRAIAAAVRRRTASGSRLLGPAEGVPAESAVELFLGGPDRPSRPRRIQPGLAADLCLLAPASAPGDPDVEVAATIIDGVPLWVTR